MTLGKVDRGYFCKVMEPQFEGQTKTKLGNKEVTGAVDKAVEKC